MSQHGQYGLQWAEVEGKDSLKMIVKERWFRAPSQRARFEKQLLASTNIVEIMGRMTRA